jgi:hypothetical protein
MSEQIQGDGFPKTLDFPLSPAKTRARSNLPLKQFMLIGSRRANPSRVERASLKSVSDVDFSVVVYSR